VGRSLATALGAVSMLLAMVPASALGTTTSLIAHLGESACSEPATPTYPIGRVTGPIAGATPTVLVGTMHVSAEQPGSGSVTLRPAIDTGGIALACVDVPADWAEVPEAVERDLLGSPGSDLAGRARFEAWTDEHGHLELVVTLVTWPVTGLAAGDGRRPCDALGGIDALLEGLAVLGLSDSWALETPDGVQLWVAWSRDRWLVGRIVGEDPVRQLAVEAMYGTDLEVGPGWTTDELFAGLRVREALANRWFVPHGRHSRSPNRWPDVVTVDTPTTDGQHGVTVDEDGIHVEFWVEPKDATVARAGGCDQ
jgi:hypothetical protein